MTKADWIKLAMPASISLLAIAVITAPILVRAQVSNGGIIFVRQAGDWKMECL